MINPAEGLIELPENTTGFGVPKFARFCKLKHSARNSSVVRSVSAAFFISDTSTLANPGPRYVPLPRLPHVPAVGSRNAFGSNHCAWSPSMTGPEKPGFTDGRSGFRVSPSPDRFEPVCGVKGNHCAVS